MYVGFYEYSLKLARLFIPEKIRSGLNGIYVVDYAYYFLNLKYVHEKRKHGKYVNSWDVVRMRILLEFESSHEAYPLKILELLW